MEIVRRNCLYVIAWSERAKLESGFNATYTWVIAFCFFFLSGKTPEEIRKTFNIKNDFTPEEEEQVGFYIFPFRKIASK